MAIDDDKFILHVKNTVGKNGKIVDDENSETELDVLDRISDFLEDIRNLTEDSKQTDINVDIKKENEQSLSVKFDNSIYNYLNDFRESLTVKNNRPSITNGFIDISNMTYTLEESIINNTKSVNDLIRTNKMSYQMQTDFGNKMKMFGNKFMDIVTTPIKLYTDVKENISSTIDFLKSPIEVMKNWLNPGGIKESGGILGKSADTKKELEIAGVVKSNLDINKVKKSSAVGVALVWFNEEMKKNLRGGDKSTDILDAIKDKFDDGFLENMFSFAGGNFIGNLITNFLKGGMISKILVPIALASAGSAIVGYTFKSRMDKAKEAGYTPEKLLDLKEGQKASKFESVVSNLSVGLAGNVGSGTASERIVGGVKNAAIMGSAATLIGGAIGSMLGSIIPGAGTVAGAIAGAKIGTAVGGITGILGDKDLAKGVVGVKNLFVEMIKPLGAITEGFEFLKDLFPGLTEGLSNLWDGIKSKSKSMWDKFWGNTDKNTTPNETITKSTIDLNNLKNVSDLSSATHSYIAKNEGGGAGSVNLNDGGVGSSIGSLQWNRGRLYELLTNMIAADRQTIADNMGEDFIKRFEEHKNWSSKGMTLTKTDKINWDKMMTDQKKLNFEDAKLLQVDTSMALRDIDGYLNIAKSKGITDNKAMMFYADMINQHGKGGANKILREAGSTNYEDLKLARNKIWNNAYNRRATNLEKMYPTIQEQIVGKTKKEEIDLSSNKINSDSNLTSLHIERERYDQDNNKQLSKAIDGLTAVIPSLAKDEKESSTAISNNTNNINSAMISNDNILNDIPRNIMTMIFGIDTIGGEKNLIG